MYRSAVPYFYTVACHNGTQGLDVASSKGLGMSNSSKHGCLFSTYSTLASSRSHSSAAAAAGGPKKKSRLEQLVDW